MYVCTLIYHWLTYGLAMSERNSNSTAKYFSWYLYSIYKVANAHIKLHPQIGLKITATY